MSHTRATRLTSAAAYRLRAGARTSIIVLLALLLTVGLSGCNPAGGRWPQM